MFILDETEILEFLQRAELDIKGEFLWGSNSTFFLTGEWEGKTAPVVYKPIRGERPLWDFPPHTLAKREVAAYLVSRALGWDFVPPTILRKQAPYGVGMLQLYIEHDPDYHYFSFSEEDRGRLRPVALFDLLINNADRKGSHILVDQQNRLWCIDHGICFHWEDKLRTVLWDFAGEAIPQPLLEDLARFEKEFIAGAVWVEELGQYLSEVEIKALWGRARLLLDNPIFPHPPEHRRPYPWPPI